MNTPKALPCYTPPECSKSALKSKSNSVARHQKRLGRRSLLTPALQRRICKLLETGNTITASCDHVGIGEATFYDWCEKHPQFQEATSRARGSARVKLVKVLTDAAQLDWRAAGWLLSHCWPQEYSETQRVEAALLGGIVLLPNKSEGAE